LQRTAWPAVKDNSAKARMETQDTIRLISAILAVVLVVIIILRRKAKGKKKDEEEF
jgi:putative copper export protein